MGDKDAGKVSALLLLLILFRVFSMEEGLRFVPVQRQLINYHVKTHISFTFIVPSSIIITVISPILIPDSLIFHLSCLFFILAIMVENYPFQQYEKGDSSPQQWIQEAFQEVEVKLQNCHVSKRR